MSSPPPSARSELLTNAVLFLTDPKVRHNSSLQSKIEFLSSKGLTEREIEQAFARAGADGGGESSGSNPGAGGGHGRERGPGGSGDERGYGAAYGSSVRLLGARPELPRRDWRDLFIMAVVSGGVVYGLTALARKYLLPHLRPPSTTSFQQTSAALTEQYDEAARLLRELQEQTTRLQTSVEEDRERVGKAVDEVEEAVRSVRDGEEQWRGEMREIRGEVESVRDLVPRMIEKHAQSQSSALADLQTELRSLKTLLQSRQAALGAPNGSSSSAPANGHPGQTQTQLAANALLAPKTGKGIPAWQMAPPSTRDGSTEDSREGSRDGSLSGSGVLEKEEVKEDGV